MLLLAVAAIGCRAASTPPPPIELAPAPIAAPSDRQAGIVAGRIVVRGGTEIIIAGKRVDVGAPVVLWSDPGGYDGYRETAYFASAGGDAGEPRKRYRPGRAPWTEASARADRPADGEPTVTLERLRELVDQFVLHYDACGTSRRCFEILHDKRALSAHFLLDLDGTIYQTLDLAETAWHARHANPRSVGVEIANIGAYPIDRREPLARWYRRNERETRITMPLDHEGGGLRTADFVARPARLEPIRGAINGVEVEMYDFTSQQYASLVRLTATLCKELPGIVPDAPRDAAGEVRVEALADDEFASFAGILGHHHVTSDKQDPGPGLDWGRLLERTRAVLRVEAGR